MRTGDWMALNSGTRWFVMDPHPDDVKIDDIAHALSLICRYGGHCREFYSVAQHSVFVAKVLRDQYGQPPETQLYGLLHDATEAYVGDVVRPLKRSLPQYKDAELRTERVIYAAFSLPPISEEDREAVKYADEVALATERRDIVNHCGHEWRLGADPANLIIQPIGPEAARFQFLTWFELLREEISPPEIPTRLALPVECSVCHKAYLSTEAHRCTFAGESRPKRMILEGEDGQTRGVLWHPELGGGEG